MFFNCGKLKKIGVFLLFFIETFFLTVFIFQLLNPSVLYFQSDHASDNQLDVFVDKVPVVHLGRHLYAQTFNIIRPVEITVGKQSKTYRVNSLQEDVIIPLEVQFTDKKQIYWLHTLPMKFPQVKVEQYQPIQEGYILISFHGLLLKDPSYCMIFDTAGHLIYYRGNEKLNYSMFHFQQWKLSNGKVRYSMHAQDAVSPTGSFINGIHFVLDENFNVIDSVRVLETKSHPALLAEEHDFVLFDDGHYLVLGYHPTDIQQKEGAISQVYSGLIQEQKDNKVVFEWDGKNYPVLIDACYENCPTTTSHSRVDFMHVNSIHVDPNDNHFIISMANTYSVIKVHRQTGEILWHLGGKKDEFGLLPNQIFHRQHDVQMLPNNQFILFDNRLIRSTGSTQARICVFELDEKEKKVNSFREIPLGFQVKYMGSVQQLPKDRWFVGCGSSNVCAAEMIDGNGKVLFRMTVNEPYTTYRAYFTETLD